VDIGKQVLESSSKILTLKHKTKRKLWRLKGKEKEGVSIVQAPILVENSNSGDGK